jgi:Helix-turn-helix domain
VSDEPPRVQWRSLALDPEYVLGPWARLAVCALCENMGGRRCYVSVPMLAARMGVSERTAYRALVEIEREGFVVVERRAGVTNLSSARCHPLHVSQGSGARCPSRGTA